MTTIIICALLIYATLNWILPNLIGGIGFINGFLKPSQKEKPVSEDVSLAPPVLNIPYEATNTAQIDIKGYASANSKVRIYLDDDQKSEVSVSDDGSFEAKDIDLSLGTNNIYGKTIDDKEKTSLPSKTIRLIFDNEKPPLVVSEPNDGQTVKDKKIKISGKTDSGAQVFINITQVIVSSDGSFSSDFELNDRDNEITIKAVDKASNFNEVTRKITYQP